MKRTIGQGKNMLISFKIYVIHMISIAREANDQYSIFALDLASVCCFIDTKETQFSLRKRHKLVVECLVRGHQPNLRPKPHKMQR